MGAKRRLNCTSKSEQTHTQTDIQTQTQTKTDIWTFRLIESIGPEGRFFEKSLYSPAGLVVSAKA